MTARPLVRFMIRFGAKLHFGVYFGMSGAELGTSEVSEILGHVRLRYLIELLYKRKR
jgi:hypothetical protein